MMVLTVNATPFAERLDDIAQSQAPFAMALTLTRSAEEAVRSEIADLPHQFHIRSQWVAKGFRVKPATKRSQTALIYHKDPFMKLQEEGGQKTPLHTQSVAVPIAARPTPQSTTPRSKWPGRFKRSFYIRKGDTVYEFARSGHGGLAKRKRHKSRFGGHLKRDLDKVARKLDPNLKLIYVMKASVSVKPRLGMAALVRRVAEERVPVNFAGFLEYALKTARPK